MRSVFCAKMDNLFWKSLIAWLMCISLSNAQSYYVDKPPASFYNRKSIDDCPEIFYSKWKPPRPFLGAAGGFRAFIGEFQHMAAIGWTSDGKIHYRCGGTLIAPKFVLTAAHCAKQGEPDTVRFGDTHLESTEDDEYAQQIKIRAFKRHPSHKFKKNYFDIALIELERDAQISEGVCPACLWLEKDLPLEKMQSVGFGATEFVDSSPTLQKVTLSAYAQDQCRSEFPVNGRELSEGIVNHQFCAGSSSMDTCQGDSGGPIQVERTDTDGYVFPMVVGVVSFGTPCSDGSVGVYTRISDFREWIESVIKTSVDYLSCTSISHTRKKNGINIYETSRSPPFYRVGLLWNVNDQNNYQCGATVIDYEYAITSAFCVKRKQNSPKFIKVESTGETVAIEKIIIHPKYSSKQPENDLALLKLSKYLKGGDDLLPACITTKQTNRENTVVKYSAFRAKKNPDMVITTDRVTIDARSESECKVLQNKQSNLLCANNSIDLIPTLCDMDYGGPVSYTSYNDGYQVDVNFLQGVVSRLSNGCGMELVGTRLSAAHVEWIENVVLEYTNDRVSFA